MTQPYEIDTSVLVRLTAGKPARDFQHCLEALRTWVEDQGHEVFPSNQVIGKAYIAIQHHYGIADAAAKDALVDVLNRGLVSPRESATHH